MSQLGQSSTEMGIPRHVRFTPVSDRLADIAGGPFRATFGRTKGQAEADIRAVTRLTICGSRRALDRFTRWVTWLMI
jgi:hypothetical protein